MKNHYALLVTLLFSITTHAQIIDIPDANFKNALLNHQPNVIDTNGDGEIQVSEAESTFNGLYVDNESINSLEGIEYFTNILYLNCSNNQLTELNVSSLTNLYSLNCSYNQITQLNLENSPNIEGLNCSYNLLTSIILPDQGIIGELNCSHNNLTTLDFSNLSLINHLSASNNQLTSIILCEIIDSIWINNNLLTEIDISNSPILDGIFCPNNLLTSIDISNNDLLVNLYASNNELTSLFLGNAENLYWPSDVFFDGNPNLSVVCTAEENFDEVQTLLTGYGYTDCTISSYCSFDPYGEYFIVQGQALLDNNNNGCDILDAFATNQAFNITSNDFYDTFYANSQGEFELYLSPGSHTITPAFENPSYFSVSPSSLTVDFPSDASPFIQDFCITPNGAYDDLEIIIIPLDEARPGFDSDYKAVYKNKGTTILSGSVDLTFQDDLMDLVSASPTEDSQSANILSWNFTDLTPFESREIYLTMNINSPMETPPVNGDDVLVFNASVNYSETDETPDDNSFTLNQTVVNSFDPNDKTCLEGDVISPEQVGDFVHYRIRFENTGTANAINIVVKDNIDRTKYDLSSLVALDASHDFVARIKDDADDYYVEFIFENINLPFDDANNDGYVVFKIRTLDTLVLNDTFENEAEIYFDFNFPIITNVAQTTVATLSTEDYELANISVLLYPNPNNGILHLETKEAIKQINVYDISGRQIKEIAIIGSKLNIEISTEALSAGTYFVKIKTTNGALMKKFIKE